MSNKSKLDTVISHEFNDVDTQIIKCDVRVLRLPSFYWANSEDWTSGIFRDFIKMALVEDNIRTSYKGVVSFSEQPNIWDLKDVAQDFFDYSNLNHDEKFYEGYGHNTNMRVSDIVTFSPTQLDYDSEDKRRHGSVEEAAESWKEFFEDCEVSKESQQRYLEDRAEWTSIFCLGIGWSHDRSFFKWSDIKRIDSLGWDNLENWKEPKAEKIYKDMQKFIHEKLYDMQEEAGYVFGKRAA